MAAWSVPAIFPWVPLFPPFIASLHAASYVHLSLFVGSCPQPAIVCTGLTALRCCFPRRNVHVVSRAPREIQPKLPLVWLGLLSLLSFLPFLLFWLFLELPPNKSLSHESWSQVLLLENPALCTQHRLSAFYALLPPIFKTTARDQYPTCPHFTDDETQDQRHLVSLTPPLPARARVPTQVWCNS